MGIETYLLIAGAYGLGCYLSYRQGVRKGTGYGARQVILDVQKVTKWPNDQMADLLMGIKNLPEYRKLNK